MKGFGIWSGSGKKLSNSCNSIKFMWPNDYFIKFHMSRLQCQVEIICCYFKIRANFKIAQLAKFLLCRDMKLLVAT